MLQSQTNAVEEFDSRITIINNICDPICEYNNFQCSMRPEIKIIIDMNNWVMLTIALKTALKTLTEISYKNIENPSSDVIADMEKAREKLDLVGDLIMNSMKDVITLVQPLLSNPQHKPREVAPFDNILDLEIL